MLDAHGGLRMAAEPARPAAVLAADLRVDALEQIAMRAG